MEHMEYTEAVNWVHSLPRLAKNPAVQNTKQLLSLLGNPEKALKFVHIAGTNGKGSVTTMLANILYKAGYKTGSTISPFVVDFRERFQINGQMISEKALEGILNRIKNVAQNQESLVEFDVVTAAAIMWFAEEKCDIVCLETGLGGRLDSTNAVENTILACITAIGKDHTELLGNTFEKIATEKCGILKNNCKVVTYPLQRAEALEQIEKCAKEKNCQLYIPKIEDFQIENTMPEALQTSIIYKGKKINLPFLGEHQGYNTMVVIKAAEILSKIGYDNVDESAIVKGIETCKFAARIEILSKNPLIILDGAHNPDGAKALGAVLKQINKNDFIAVVGALEGKGAEQMLSLLCPYFSQLYTVSVNSNRGLTQKQLSQMAKGKVESIFDEYTVETAIKKAMETSAKTGKGVLICGSLYLASQARRILVNC